MTKKIYKSKTNAKVCGVCGGIGEYLNIDPTLIRIIWLIITFTGAGLLAYIVCAYIIPEAPETASNNNDNNNGGFVDYREKR